MRSGCRAGAGEPRAAPSERDPRERVGFLRGGARPPTTLVVEFIDEHKDQFGVEPICRHGSVRGRGKRTTVPGKDGRRAGDLGNRGFTASAPNQLWVGDSTYVRTWAGFSYVAFVIDVFSRMIVGWKADTSMRADLVTDTLEMAVWSRGRAGVTDFTGLIHHTRARSTSAWR